MTNYDRIASQVGLHELLMNLIPPLILLVSSDSFLFLIRYHEIMIAPVWLYLGWLLLLWSELFEVSLAQEVVADFKLIDWGSVIVDVNKIDILAGRRRLHVYWDILNWQGQFPITQSFGA
jgi:hypothetical protein